VSEKKTITLSVVVPCYNEEDAIAACLDALIAQKDAIHEIIVVDNNSSDATHGIVQSYCEQYPKIRLLSEQQQGVQFARNRGFDEARGNVIARIDVDTLVDPGWAKTLVGYYLLPENEEVGAASGPVWYYDLPFRRVTNFFAKVFIFDMNRKTSTTHPPLTGSNTTMRKDVWKAIRSKVCMEPGIMEDMDIGFHTNQAGYRVEYIPNAWVGISGRRMRMSPLRFWQYNRQCWMTYHHHGYYKEARKIKVFVALGNILHVFGWVGLLFHNPDTNKISIIPRYDRKKERVIP
jgi:glycosyltransferase involved in cell wall biosynthesis